jgi:hypothetical protein
VTDLSFKDLSVYMKLETIAQAPGGYISFSGPFKSTVIFINF